MNKKRNRLEVIKDILEVLKMNRETKITHIIYKANLSNNSIKPYIENLIKNDLIKEHNNADRKFFTLTEKGFSFLEEFDKIKIFSESYGL